MRIISKKTLKEFWVRHPESERSLQAWHQEVAQADWATPAQVKGRFPNASIVGGNRVVFNISGDQFRLVVWIQYRLRLVYVKWLGTHAEYNRIDVEKVGL